MPIEISSVKDADEIIILQDGEIIERGTHDQLIELKGKYYQTLMEQYSEYSQYLGKNELGLDLEAHKLSNLSVKIFVQKHLM